MRNFFLGTFVLCGIIAATVVLQNFIKNTSNQSASKKITRVYVDGVFDLFHLGHASFLEKARTLGDCLIVWVCSDEECTDYKRKPILTIEERVKSVEGCRYADEVISNAPLVPDAKFFDKHKIDIVVHGDDFDKEKLYKYYGAAIDKGIFRTVPYSKGISTTDIVQRILSRRW